MIRIRRGVVTDARVRHPGLLEVQVEVEGAPATAYAYETLCGGIRTGDIVILNTTAVELGLGTGGVHFVIAVEGRERDDPPPGSAMKLRYTPVQAAVAAVEETHTEAIDAIGSLAELPVIAIGLHSALAPALLGMHAVAPEARAVYVMTDGGALMLALSDSVAALRDAGLLTAVITAGQTFGGDLEAISLHGALAAALAVCRADVVVVGMGPGNPGTGSRWGFGSIEVGAIVNAAASLGGRPIAAPRISFADTRDRHRGVSHHSLTALGVAALARAEVAIPALPSERAALVRAQLADAGIDERHDIVEVDTAVVEAMLREPPVPLRTMGRGHAEDPDHFRAAAAAGILAARALRGNG